MKGARERRKEKQRYPAFATPVCLLLSCRLDAHNILRPETVESLYYLYWVTGNEGYRDHAWAIFQAFERHCRVDRGGYAGLEDVTDVSGAISLFFSIS